MRKTMNTTDFQKDGSDAENRSAKKPKKESRRCVKNIFF